MVSFRQAFRPQPAGPAPTKAFRVIVPVSGEDSDVRLLQIVERIAQRQNANITIVYVVEVQQSMPLDAELPAEIERGENVLGDAEAFASRCVGGRRENVRTELLQARSAGAAIVDEAIEAGANAIILAAELRKRYGRLEIGSTVEYVLLHAPCEVVVIRRAHEEWSPETMEQP